MKIISFSEEPPSASSLALKRGALRRHERLGAMPLSGQREELQRLHKAALLPPGTNAGSVLARGVPCEWLQKDGASYKKAVLYIHGGGWVLGDLSVARHAGSLLAASFGRRVLTVGYRLAPEHPFPAGLNDCRDAYLWLLENGYSPRDIALAGDSAGGNLALCLLALLLETQTPLPSAAVLFSPVTDLGEGSELRKNPIPLCHTIYKGERRSVFELYTDLDPQNPLISPVAGNLSEYPPILIHVGSDEPLAADCAAFAEKSFLLGGRARCKIWNDMFHDFSIFGPALKESRESLAEAAEFLRAVQAETP
ncbi:MAG: alpha/beta hydrolase [Oscillospiraceae bacterium]|jgi:acetyl esterase/lipase|nr:alpha/beta hydrolase [Oscillospiraceae bacterium]